jgi:hypothetical protein
MTGDEPDGTGRVEACFDHVALALQRMTDGWPVLAEALGGRYRSQGLAVGYSWLQLQFANGFTLETLHPEEIPDDLPRTGEPGERRPDHRGEFVRRFLDRSGAGPHHLTFTVEDLDTAMASLHAAGLTPGVVDRTDPSWHEALYSATQAHGIVLQVVRTTGAHGPVPGPPEGFPELGFDHPIAGFGRVVHAVADLEGAVSLFRDGLGGTITSTGSAVDGNHWVELGWRGVGRLRLLEAAHAEIAEWVGDRPGRLRHLYFTFDEPQTVPGARQAAEGRWVVEPDDALGVRLVIASAVR